MTDCRNCFEATLPTRFAEDFRFEPDLTATVEKLMELYVAAEEQNEIRTDHAYWGAICLWVESETGRKISMSQARQFESYAFEMDEEFKKKQLWQRKLPTSISSTPASSTPPPSVDSQPSSPASTPSMKGSAETQTAS